MAKSSHSKIVSTTPQNDTQSDVGNPASKDKAASKLSNRQSIKGYIYPDHPPDFPNLIIGDPKNPKNIIHGKRTRQGSSMHDSQLGKATNPISVPDDDEPMPAQRATLTAVSPTAPRKHKDRAHEKALKNIASVECSDRELPTHAEEDEPATPQDKISPEDIRRGVLALVNRSLQVGNDVAAYMQLVEGHDVQGQKLCRDVARAMTRRGKKRKADVELDADNGKSGKAVKFAL